MEPVLRRAMESTDPLWTIAHKQMGHNSHGRHPQMARQASTFELYHEVRLSRGGSNPESDLWVPWQPRHDGNSEGKMTDAERPGRGKSQDWSRKRRLGGLKHKGEILP